MTEVNKAQFVQMRVAWHLSGNIEMQLQVMPAQSTAAIVDLWHTGLPEWSVRRAAQPARPRQLPATCGAAEALVWHTRGTSDHPH